MDDLSDDIIKYKKGELNPEQMHALEKRALADPFLAEALEGLENISVEDLTADILSINKNIGHQKKTVLFTPLRIAAGILLLIGSVFLIYQFRPKPETMAMKMEKPKAGEKTEIKSAESKDEGEKSSVESSKQKVQSKKLKSEEDKSKSSERLTARIEHQEPSNQPQASSNHQPPTTNHQQKSKLAQPALSNSNAAGQASPAPIESLASAEKQIQAEEADMADKKINEVAEPEERDASAKRAYADKKKGSLAVSQARRSEPPISFKTSKTISGKVVSAEDGTPLPGVSVEIKGTTTGTATDPQGNYSIPVNDDNSRLVFSFIGFQQKEVNVKGQEKLDVQMKEEISQLGEVVVTSERTSSDGGSVKILAEPLGGKKAYDAYLESNLTMPDDAKKNKVKGKAGIEFKINPDGSLSDFKIIKKLGYGCEEEIIRLVNEGPKWIPTRVDGRPVETAVRVVLRFDTTKSGR